MPTANLKVEFEVAVPGSIIGPGNGDPNCHECEKGSRQSLYNGLAQVSLQSWRAGSGTVKLRTMAESLKPCKMSIRIQAVTPPAAVADID